MLDQEEFQRLSRPLYLERRSLLQKAQDAGLTEVENKRVARIGEVIRRLWRRHLKVMFACGEF